MVRLSMSTIQQPSQFAIFHLEGRAQVHGHESFVPKSQLGTIMFVAPDDRDPVIASGHYLSNQVISHITSLASSQKSGNSPGGVFDANECL